MKIKRIARRSHRIGAIITALPFFIVIISGILLQLKKEITWVQPAVQQGSGFSEKMTLQEILEYAKEYPDSPVKTWQDIERIDVRPDEGIIKVRTKNYREIQIDAETGEILHSALRRSDVIEDIHKGSWFFSGARIWIFLPSAVIVLILWISGLIMLNTPFWFRRDKK